MNTQTQAASVQDIYNSHKPDDDLDLIILCGEMLIKYGLKAEVEAVYIKNPTITMAMGRHSVVQRWALDKYWRNQILWLENTSEVKPDTFDIRQHLALGGSNEMWLALFERYLIPFILHHQLPTHLPDFF